MVDFNDDKLNAAVTSGTSPSAPLGARVINNQLKTWPSRPSDDLPPIRISFTVRAAVAPALRSAIEEISNDIGGRLTGSHRYAKEQALTDAAIALAELRVAVTRKVPAGDPNYV